MSTRGNVRGRSTKFRNVMLSVLATTVLALGSPTAVCAQSPPPPVAGGIYDSFGREPGSDNRLPPNDRSLKIEALGLGGLRISISDGKGVFEGSQFLVRKWRRQLRRAPRELLPELRDGAGPQGHTGGGGHLRLPHQRPDRRLRPVLPAARRPAAERGDQAPLMRGAARAPSKSPLSSTRSDGFASPGGSSSRVRRELGRCGPPRVRENASASVCSTGCTTSSCATRARPRR